MSFIPVEEIFDPESMPESRMYEGKKVCIGLPFYKSTNPRTMFSIMALLDRTKTAIMLNHGDACVFHSRNTLVDNFLKSNMEWILMIDDDVIVPFSNAKLFNSFTGFNFPDKFAGFNTIDRLLSHGRTLVGGLYFGRQEFKSKPVYSEGAESKQEEDFVRRGPTDLVKPCRWVGTGCWLAHRTVFTDIEKKFPHLARNSSGLNGQWFSPSEAELRNAVTVALNELSGGGDPEELREKVTRILEDGLKLSRKFSGVGTGEDVTACHRAAAAGHQPFVDLGLVCGHVGEAVFGPKQRL